MSGTTVSTFADLNAAIEAADSLTSGTDTIVISGTITETTDLEAINLHAGVSLVIEGGTINGASAYEGLFVYQGTVTVENLTIENAVAKGGNGGNGGTRGDGGGGGAGLGWAVACSLLVQRKGRRGVTSLSAM
jgi:hypothetical protein